MIGMSANGCEAARSICSCFFVALDLDRDLVSADAQGTRECPMPVVVDILAATFASIRLCSALLVHPSSARLIRSLILLSQPCSHRGSVQYPRPTCDLLAQTYSAPQIRHLGVRYLADLCSPLLLSRPLMAPPRPISDLSRHDFEQLGRVRTSS